jgi:hypothetical protein
MTKTEYNIMMMIISSLIGWIIGATIGIIIVKVFM